jgi:hypothetical protein
MLIRKAFSRSVLFVLMADKRGMATGASVYRADGVRITHDPYAPGLAEKYGLPGATDNEGFDPYRDTVGPGIYSGSVKRDPEGRVITGKQYQNHNPNPGPVYDGQGYSLMAKAIQSGPDTVSKILTDFPDLVGEISTGGATPLHSCGMSRQGQQSTQILFDLGADINAVDTYGYKPIHRMASNNLAIGFRALVAAGADPNERTGKPYAGETAVSIARQSHALDVLEVVRDLQSNKS